MTKGRFLYSEKKAKYCEYFIVRASGTRSRLGIGPTLICNRCSMKGHYSKLLFTTIILVVSLDLYSQSSIGLSVNYGDNLTFSPNYRELLLKRRSFTPTLVYAYEKEIRSGFSVMIGGQVGIAGYQLVPVLRDTLGPSGDRSPFVDYGIFLARVELTPGKVFHFRGRNLFVGFGGGISYYRVFPLTTMSVFVMYQDSPVKVFDAYIESPDEGVFTGFGKVYVQTELSKRFDIAFQYSRHLGSILAGEFEFYHTKTPASGSIKLTPQAFSVTLLYRFKRRL